MIAYIRNITFCLLFMFIPATAQSDLISDVTITSEGSEILQRLALLDSFTGVEFSGDLQEKYNAVVKLLANAASKEPGSDEAQSLIAEADSAYSSFMDSYGQQFELLKEITEQSYEEIFEAIDWSSDAYKACVGYRGELLDVLNANNEGVASTLNSNSTLNDDLAECEARLNAASTRLNALIVEWESEVKGKKDRVVELKEAHAKAVEDGNAEEAEAIQNEIDKIENEEIPELERKIKKSKKVSKSFSLEKLLGGLGKIALGVLTILFSGECGEDAKGACSNVGIGLINEGGKDVADAFDPPDETKTWEETVAQPAERSADVEEKEKNITEAVNSKSTPLCCPPDDIKPDMIVVQSNEEGPLSFGYEMLEGGVSKIILINNADGNILAEIEDSLLFYTRGEGDPELSTKAFISLDTAHTQKTDGNTHLVVFSGTLVDGKKATLGIAVSPLTFSGKYKIIFKPNT